MRRVSGATVGGIVAVFLLAFWFLFALGPGFQDLSLPGEGGGASTYRVSAAFNDVLNVEPGAPIKEGGLPIGKVHAIRSDGWRAIVELDVDTRYRIPVDSIARLRYDTPLGEMFVDISPSGATANLKAGDLIPLAKTDTAPTVEDTLSQASLLINGGGLGQLGTINRELDKALNGREGTTRAALEQTQAFLHGANQSAQDMGNALQALAGASEALNQRRGVFHQAIAEIGPAAAVLNSDTPLLSQLLTQSSALTARANTVVGQTQSALINIVTQLGPILDQVVASTPNYLHGSQSLAKAAHDLPLWIPGDFVPLNVLLDTSAPGRLLPGLAGTQGSGSPTAPGVLPLPLPNVTGIVGGLLSPPTPSSSPSAGLGGLLRGLL